jgi:transcription factor CON7
MSTAYTSPGTAQPTSPSSPGRKLAFHLQNGHTQHMDGRQTDYPQSGLISPYPTLSKPHSEGSSVEQPAAAQYPQGQDPRSSNFSSSATPNSEYGIAPSSARSGSFPEYIQRPHYTPTGQGPPTGGMAQATSPSMPLQENQTSNSNPQHVKSDREVPIDPSIAASPTYPPQPQYSPYQAPDMSHYPAAHPGVYARPEWAQGQYAGPPPMPHYGHPASSGPPSAGLVSPVLHPIHKLKRGFRTFPLTLIIGRTPRHCVLLCADPRRATTQASAKTLRRD